ncbi:ABC transporter ATP-binding protein [Staphylococcus agnetis]|uniref:ABC transporter ATP-binding protein n=1 Tax=Staphylococcus agnetis TaxID=985762 RepID=UPI00208F2031|nr:ABC transporter ATP-binding protein [Staphylococcus agnetis]MCO4346593.1 ABC transporter ATP-binding protein [Staphylococcus agnetis]
MLTFKNVFVSLNNNTILENVNYKFKKNTIYGLLGPNGAGKTTLFKSILGVIKYSGSIEVASSNIGHLIEYPAFYGNLTCEENLNMHAKYMGHNNPNTDQLLSKVDLLEMKNKKFKNLSMGMKQRLGIARSLIGNSDLILLDEPSNGLDPFGIKDIRNIILNDVKKKNRITIVSSHILQEISEFTDIFIFIKNGRIISHLKNTGNYAMIKTADLNKINITQKNEFSIIKSYDDYYIIGDYNNLVLYDKSIEKMTIEDIYISVMKIDIEEVFLK